MKAKKCLRLLRGYSDVDAEVSEIASSLAAEKVSLFMTSTFSI